MDLRKFRSLSKNWEALAEADPLFGVLSDPSKQHGRWDTDEFFESGRAHVRKWLDIVASLGVTYGHGTCLDFGCGVGRLTLPLSEQFDHTIGVDVARSMIAAARRHTPAGGRCDFRVNRDPDLRQFQSDAFDLVHSCLVLQHIAPDVSAHYIGEFLRVTRPGGIAMFQVPAETRTEEMISAMYALAESAYAADLRILRAPSVMEAGARAPLEILVRNAGSAAWRHDIPAGRHVCLANHWRDRDDAVAVPDDGRSVLPQTIEPGESATLTLTIQAPADPGPYDIEIDLVQERVCWFAQKGSRTVRAPVTVIAPAATPPPVTAPEVRPRAPWLTKIRRRLKGGTPTFEMHVVPRSAVESAVAANGGTVLHAIDDNAAGERWLSYTYVCRKARATLS
jgi:SAM-dependent methyltransferase